ncbi:hypothetical protein FHP29_09440 [Nocardioides albidus]|uniref:DUF3558 domain-containing protein n=1 Tax=Nocardioides albidus TaxID=1517589 RepID=A0A5C4VZB9_9ACTN|nr:hypothetical protein [Nocardioides albidus]TNM41211.1 hypothetical protein FHP29_09440 [Nocardioides albidus]
MPRILVLCCLLLGLAACRGSDGSGAGPAPVAPHPFPARTPGVPAGYREVLCPDLRGDGTGLTARLVVPVTTTGGQASGGSCSFSQDFDRGIGVEIAPTRTLTQWRRTHLDPFEADRGDGGDDAVSDIVHDTGVPGFDGVRGEELAWRSYNDGSPTRSLVVLAAGVRLSWTVPEDVELDRDAFDLVRRSVALVEGTEARCPSWGRADRPTLSFSPPKDIGWVERDGDHCRISVEGSPTLLEYGAVDPTPPPLDHLAARVRHDPEAQRVRLERGVGRIDGQPADRLTWLVVREKETESYEPPGTWRIVVLQSAAARVEWGATPAWWRTHRSTYDDLVASVRVSPGPPSPP